MKEHIKDMKDEIKDMKDEMIRHIAEKEDLK